MGTAYNMHSKRSDAAAKLRIHRKSRACAVILLFFAFPVMICASEMSSASTHHGRQKLSRSVSLSSDLNDSCGYLDCKDASNTYIPAHCLATKVQQNSFQNTDGKSSSQRPLRLRAREGKIQANLVYTQIQTQLFPEMRF